jgi:hypothetical protein
MKLAIVVIVMLVALSTAVPLQAQYAEPCRYFTYFLTLNVSQSSTSNLYSAESSVTCYDEYINPYAGAFTAEAHVSDETNGGPIDSRSFDSTSCYTCAIATWYAYMSGVATANHCYRAYNNSQSPFYSNGLGTAPSCAGAAPVCTLTTYIDTDGYRVRIDERTGERPCGSSQSMTANAYPGFHFMEWNGTYQTYSATIAFIMLGDVEETAYFEHDPPPPDPEPLPVCQLCTPIVVNFANAGYELTGADSPVLFDIAATGQPRRIGWTAGEADEAFLCVDRNQNGTIDNGAELFGNATVLKDGRRAGNGFIALSEYDDNRDGVVDARDVAWGRLLLWWDRNHDGISQPSEITSVIGSRLAAISLDYHWTGRLDRSGNIFSYEAKAWIGNTGHQITARPLYDVFFVLVP